MNSEYHTTCPYCGAQTIITDLPEIGTDKGEKNNCTTCHRPYVVYLSESQLRRHDDRGVRAVYVDTHEYRSDGMYYIEFLENEHAHPQVIQIPEGVSIIGRHNRDSTAELQHFTGDITMERQHAKIQLKPNGSCLVSDNNSKAGVYVNGHRLLSRELRRLEDGDVLTLGASTAIVHLPSGEELPWEF